MRDRWSEAPIQFVTLPACLKCGSVDFERKKTTNGGDGSKAWRLQCNACGSRWVVVFEVPDSFDDCPIGAMR